MDRSRRGLGPVTPRAAQTGIRGDFVIGSHAFLGKARAEKRTPRVTDDPDRTSQERAAVAPARSDPSERVGYSLQVRVAVLPGSGRGDPGERKVGNDHHVTAPGQAD